jgi:hypothetical protein
MTPCLREGTGTVQSGKMLIGVQGTRRIAGPFAFPQASGPFLRFAVRVKGDPMRTRQSCVEALAACLRDGRPRHGLCRAA